MFLVKCQSSGTRCDIINAAERKSFDSSVEETWDKRTIILYHPVRNKSRKYELALFTRVFGEQFSLLSNLAR